MALYQGCRGQAWVSPPGTSSAWDLEEFPPPQLPLGRGKPSTQLKASTKATLGCL